LNNNGVVDQGWFGFKQHIGLLGCNVAGGEDAQQDNC
jgi:hypothetical protein